MIAVSDLGKAFGAQTLFEGVSIQFNPGNRYGLVGANGSGKSTLLRILSGEESPSRGVVSIPRKLTLGVLSQDHFRYEAMPILDVAMMGNREVWEAMAEKERLLHDDSEFHGDRYAELEDVILRNQGYSLEARAGEILEGLGIPTEVHRSPLSTLSGGFKLRVLLAQVLAAEPGALLLDEPTNHLDIVSIRWLEKFLVSYKGLAIVISHDLRFLDNVCTHIADVDYETVTLYPGNYTAFEAAKEAERERKEAEIQKREKQIAGHQAFVDRFRAKATKARQAQSKIKLIEKIVIEKLPEVARHRKAPHRRPQRQHVAGFASGEVDPHPALRAFEFDHQAVTGIALHIADHEARALAPAVREQVHQHSFKLIEQPGAQLVLVVAPLDTVGRVVEVEVGMGRDVDRVDYDGAHWVCSPSSRALTQSPLARTQK